MAIPTIPGVTPLAADVAALPGCNRGSNWAAREAIQHRISYVRGVAAPEPHFGRHAGQRVKPKIVPKSMALGYADDGARARQTYTCTCVIHRIYFRVTFKAAATFLILEDFQ